MTSSARIALAALALSCATALSAPAAHALTAKECHQNFTAARTAGTLNGKSFKEFKAATCDAPATTAETPATSPAAPAATTGTTPTEAAKPATTPVSSAGVIFPSAIASQYASLSAGKGRMKTCLDQYKANKTSGGNGSLKWIQKGGGYYSQCNTRLKGG
ncbi:hypothetical protein [Acetobacter sp.]|uniref:hypothetical protein n=1 Tax=Acetobacter sp. TaxID=440 RepID=UPI002590009A|nr:hypothetical protein [Acetobacter sp.]MCC6105607.1 hypothetical protein [Acetobacter sp.]